MHTIRSWEKRYGALSPGRTATNRRLYTDDDVERLVLLSSALKKGHSIGHVAKVPIEDLRKLAKQSGFLSQGASSFLIPAQELARECERAIDVLDGDAIESALTRGIVTLGATQVLDDVIVPLLGLIDQRQHEGSFQISHEHLFSATVRSFLDRVRQSITVSPGAPAALVTTPAGQTHEIGALLACFVLALEGWRVTYLGPNLPASDIARSAKLMDARLVALSIVWPIDDPRLEDDLRQLPEGLPPATLVLAGGRGAESFRNVLEDIGAEIIGSLPDLRARLARYRDQRSMATKPVDSGTDRR